MDRKIIIEHFLELGHRLKELIEQPAQQREKIHTKGMLLLTTEIKECSQKFSKEKKKIAWHQASQHWVQKMGMRGGGESCLLNPERNGFDLGVSSPLTSLRCETKQISRHATGLSISPRPHFFCLRK